MCCRDNGPEIGALKKCYTKVDLSTTINKIWHKQKYYEKIVESLLKKAEKLTTLKIFLKWKFYSSFLQNVMGWVCMGVDRILGSG